MSAMVTGVKTNQGVLSLDQSVDYDEMDSAKVKRAHRKTLLEMAEEHGLANRYRHNDPASPMQHPLPITRIPATATGRRILIFQTVF